MSERIDELYRYALFSEEIVKEILRALDFYVDNTNECLRTTCLCDCIAIKNGKNYAIEIKATRRMIAPTDMVKAAINHVMKAVKYPLNGYIPTVIVIGQVSDMLKKKMEAEFPQLLLLDLSNLLYIVQNDEELSNKLISGLPYTIADLQPVETDLGQVMPRTLSSENIWDVYIRQIKDWKAGKNTCTEYEKVCSELLKDLFVDDLTKWQKQKNTNAGLFRMDAIAKIKRGNNKEFWEMAEQYFQTKYVVFEYKNYSNEITQEQVFTTVKYLYAKALRRIAILIAVKGADDNANTAIRGILREEGKLIIALSNEDLLKMLEMKKKKEDPAEYLSDKLDELLIDLEK